MNNSNKAVFLDRDGVINDLVFYPEEGMIDSPNSPKQFKLINGVGEALTQLKKMRFLLILISNQPGIAKGKYNLGEFNKIKPQPLSKIFDPNNPLMKIRLYIKLK